MSNETKPRLHGVDMTLVEHSLKTWREPFRAIWAMRKRYELRRNDRHYNVGDILLLREWHENENRYTGRWIRVLVMYISHGDEWGLPQDLCVMSIEEVARYE
jgi:hypothetical protein